MCGICGICNLDSGEPVDRGLLERMCSVIEHRGPDERGIHVDASVGLGMRRLSIIDLESGSQPVFNEDRNICVVFNGEIYNFQPLRTELEDRGHRFDTNGDTEVIVHLYEEYGVDFVTHLNGMFAIALWDRAKRRFLLVRDRLGQKPLYYAQTRDGLTFGSEIKCLLQCMHVPTDLDHEAIYHYFTLGYIPHPRSAYSAIRQLTPGGRLVIQNGRTKIDRYWTLAGEVDATADRQVAKEQLRTLLQDAVRLRMISDVPLGAFLSGGLDSSITVALMAMASASPIQTFHIDFGEPELSEMAYARQVAERYGTEHHELIVTPSATEILDDLVAFFDEPFGDSSAVPTFYVSKLTRESVTVALAGDGGDESFGGYHDYRRILSRRNLPSVVRSALGLPGNLIHLCLPRRAPGRRYFRSLGMSNFQMFAVGTRELETREILSSRFLESVSAASTFEMLKSCSSNIATKDLLARYTFSDIQHYLPDDILTKVDRMSMAHSLEVRSPFLDHRVVELAATFPCKWKIRGDDAKVILEETFAADLPRSILRRRKRGFSMPIASWLRGELKPVLDDTLHDAEIESAEIFRMKEVRALANEHQSGRRDRADFLWRYLFFVRWWHQRGRNRRAGSFQSNAFESLKQSS